MNNPNMNNPMIINQILTNRNQQHGNVSGDLNTNINFQSNANNYLTQVGNLNYEGYDIAGCRYDFRNSPQNGVLYGPPLSWCNTYNKSKVQTTGTLWYPLHG
jgi:hypothetical protein